MLRDSKPERRHPSDLVQLYLTQPSSDGRTWPPQVPVVNGAERGQCAQYIAPEVGRGLGDWLGIVMGRPRPIRSKLDTSAHG